MTASENIRRRLGVMFLTSPLIGLMIATPVFLLTQTSIFNLPWIALMISSLSLISWLLNIFLLNFNPIKLNSVFFKWFLSTIFMVLLVSTLHTLTFDLVAFNIKHIWIIRAVNITAVNTIIVIINTLIDTREKKIKLENENNQLKIIQLETQLAHLTNQINPHFLFNSLSSLKSLIRRNPLMAENYLLKLSDFLRISISKSKDLV
jgi:sensor histidine kinase YesM